VYPDGLLFGLLSPSQEADARLRDLTITWSRFGYQGEILEADELDALLAAALARGAAYCLVQTPGNVLVELRPAVSDPPARLEDVLGGLLQEHTGAAVFGRRDGDGVDRRCFVVDLVRYAELCRPSLDALPMHDLGPVLERCTAWLGDPPDAAAFRSDVDHHLHVARRGVFVLNVEPYDDVRMPPPGFVGPVSTLYSVAAGFKPNVLLHAFGLDRETRVVFFDYSAPALEAKRRLLEWWDGDDFPAAARRLFGELPEPGAVYHLWNGLTPATLPADDLEEAWVAELTHWGGADVFQAAWEQYRRLPHELVHCDVVADPEPLLARIDTGPDAVIWWSNAFFTVSANWQLSSDERWRRYRHFVAAVAQHNPELHLFGSDPSNASVNHVRAAEYRDLLDGIPVSNLTPIKAAACEIRF
jgi:hypothetical protein